MYRKAILAIVISIIVLATVELYCRTEGKYKTYMEAIGSTAPYISGYTAHDRSWVSYGTGS